MPSMTRPSAARVAFVSLAMALTVGACGGAEAPPTHQTESTTEGDQALPVDQGDHADPQALPVDQGATQLNAGAGTCTSDADCVPAQCCHATSCTLQTAAPDCSQAMCTRDCRGGTLDCGGSCYCNHGQCAARVVDVRDQEAAGS